MTIVCQDIIRDNMFTLKCPIKDLLNIPNVIRQLPHYIYKRTALLATSFHILRLMIEILAVSLFAFHGLCLEQEMSDTA